MIFRVYFVVYVYLQINYYFDEDNGWSLDMDELRRFLNEVRFYCVFRVLCVINFGNLIGIGFQLKLWLIFEFFFVNIILYCYLQLREYKCVNGFLGLSGENREFSYFY